MVGRGGRPDATNRLPAPVSLEQAGGDDDSNRLSVPERSRDMSIAVLGAPRARLSSHSWSTDTHAVPVPALPLVRAART